jgi:hypothetical protein
MIKSEQMVNQRNIKKKRKLKDTISQTNDSDHKFLELWNTLWAYESFCFIATIYNLYYLPLKILSNQVSKQPRPICSALKMQIFFS